MNDKQRWDIFCKVIDNYGDAGVCWRLAKQLASLPQLEVRLWIDDLVCLTQLAPHLSTGRDKQQALPNLSICRWEAPFSMVIPAQVVIEAFACTLPESYVQAMTQQDTQPIWINLEYLSAESWTEACHGLCSPHPFLPLKKYFFFPGFNTGGLLRESNYGERQQIWQASPEIHSPAVLANCLTNAIRKEPGLVVSLFSYENPALPGLLKVWSQGQSIIHCLAPLTSQIKNLSSFFDVSSLSSSQSLSLGSLRFHILPFFTQEDYDSLLWSSDINFVRGEDSFVRAQLAAKPMVWQLYPQADDAHLSKLEAFLDLYAKILDPLSQQIMRDFYLAWNTGSNCASLWNDYCACLRALAVHALEWTQKLYAQGDLTSNLYQFVQEKINGTNQTD